MAEPESEQPRPRQISRRSLLRGAGIGIAGLAGKALIGTENRAEAPAKTHFQLDPQSYASPAEAKSKSQLIKQDNNLAPAGNLTENQRTPQLEIPQDVLTPEQLEEAHIRIIDTPGTELYLRDDALDQFRLFQEAKEGKIGEVVIVLVDSDSVSANAIQKLPQEARDIWLATNDLPGEDREYLRELHSDFIEKIEESRLEYTGNPQDQAKRELALENMREYGKSLEFVQDILSKLPLRSREELLKEKEFSNVGGKYTPAMLSNYKVEGRLATPREKRAEKLFAEHPEYADKIYLFLAVGGVMEPHPYQSFTPPPWFSDNPFEFNGQEYRFRDRPLSFQFRHELFHRESDDEYQTDTAAFENMKKAYVDLKFKGNDRGYPFIFKNRNGVTIIMNLKDTAEPSNL
ncbi:MAG: hypothetical protein NUV69_00965 [Candidatus Curtissbacteria bacterium]|nr:hypothetical protein [Candidatus Curtissbacteria bacterium]